MFGHAMNHSAATQAEIMDALVKIKQSQLNNGSPTATLTEPMNEDKTQRAMWTMLKSGRHTAGLTSLPLPMSENDDEHFQKIISSLWFEKMDYREGAIPEAHAKTFNWISRSPVQMPQESRNGQASQPGLKIHHPAVGCIGLQGNLELESLPLSSLCTAKSEPKLLFRNGRWTSPYSSSTTTFGPVAANSSGHLKGYYAPCCFKPSANDGISSPKFLAAGGQ